MLIFLVAKAKHLRTGRGGVERAGLARNLVANTGVGANTVVRLRLLSGSTCTNGSVR